MSLTDFVEIPGTSFTRNHATGFFTWMESVVAAVNAVEGGMTLQKGVKAITADAGLNAASNGDTLTSLLPFSDDGVPAMVIGGFAEDDYLLSSNGASSKLFHVYSLASVLYVEDADGTYAPDGMTALATGDTFFVQNDLVDATAGEELFAIYAFNGTALVKLGDVDYATEIDNIVGSLGASVDTDGNYVARTTTTYIDANADIDEDLTDLDTQMATNTAGVADNTADLTAVSVGTAGTNVVATEYGGKIHQTTLTLTDVVLGAPTAGGNSAHGAVVYTFPAGVHMQKHSYFSIGLTIGTVTTDTPDVALGSVIGAGAIAVLNGGTMEDYVTAVTWATALDGTAEVQATIAATAGLYTGIANNAAANVKELHLNAADGWNVGVTGNLTASGTIVITWETIA